MYMQNNSKNCLYVIYGDKPKEMAISILEKMDIEQDLLELGKKEPLIGIKPNLVVAQPAEWGATTSPQLVRGVIEYLHAHGFKNTVILESSWIGDSTKKAFRVCGYEEISRHYGVQLIDLKQDKSQEFDVNGIKINVCSKALRVDYLINMPVLKAHCQTKITCALKNLKGCIPDTEKRRFHKLGLHHPIACLNKILTTNLIIVDGIIGDLTHEEGGTPVRMNRVIGGRDPVLVDTYVAELMGYSAEDIEYIGISEKMGIGSTELTQDKIIELNSSQKDPAVNEILASREVDYLSQWVIEDRACSACYGSLIHALMRLKEKGKLKKLPKRIYIGQGYKDQKSPEIGIGLCTKKFKHNVPGCPPDAKKIVDFLESIISRSTPSV
ncbi:MAG: hypothetical protein PWQ82_1740 [Thermosediminibacterales bacterium]|nr:hypothetical protein [Thermosediminibacterales bacterium]MDK2836802.1 hypothetical protein [Thermosediminibacterales bacterium]